MYKSDISEGLARLALVPGGAIGGLLELLKAASAKVDSALAELVRGSGDNLKNAYSILHDALAPISARLAEISPSATVVELHQLGFQFDAVLAAYPTLELLLRPGRQAAADLAGAFDFVLQKNKGPSAVVGLFRPGTALASAYAHYDALSTILAPSETNIGEAEAASVEIDHAQEMDVFANHMGLLAYLAKTASELIGEGDVSIVNARGSVWIASIESGSPIRINLLGDGKTLRLFLTMLRDLVRLPYLYLTSHGRTLQSMETFARAKELGIDSPEVLKKLENAMNEAAKHYAGSVGRREAFVSVNGKRIESTLALPVPEITATGVAPQLPAPSE